MRRLLWLVAAACVAALAACGGPAAGPPTPQATSVTPAVAERGDAIVIAGSGFGTTQGSVQVGGVAATVTDWTASSITATVPAGAPNAWQDVSVTTAGGTDTVEDLFVGAEFSGTGPQLQAYLDSLPNGTAVLLQASTYDLSAQVTPFIIDNKDLYGRGRADTTLVQPTTAQTFVFADFGATVTIADLTMAGDDFAYMHGTLQDTVTPFALGDAANLPTDLDGLKAHVARLVQGAPLRPAAATNPRIVFDHMTFDETAAGTWGLAVLVLPKVDLHLRDSILDAPASQVGMLTAGDITIESSVVTAMLIQVASLTGQVNYLDSELRSSFATLSGAESGLTIADSTLKVTDGELVLMGAAASMIGGSTLPSGGAIEVRGSTIEVLDANPLDASDHGAVTVLTQFAPISFIDNLVLRSHDEFMIGTLDSQTGESDIELIGNLDVRVGIYQADVPAGARAAGLQVVPSSSSLRNRLTLEGNTIAATSQVVAYTGASPGNVFVTDNVITAGDTGIPGAVVLSAASEGIVEVTGNDITANSQVIITGIDLAGGTLLVSGNRLTGTAATPKTVVIQGVGGSCRVTDNEVVLDDPSDTNASTVAGICMGVDPSHSFVVTGNDVTATGNPASGIALLNTNDGPFEVTDNQFSTGQVVQVQGPDAALDFSNNTIELDTGSVFVIGNTGSVFTIDGNTVTQRDPLEYGLALNGVGQATVTNNTFTGLGTPSAFATALHVGAALNAVSVTATGNTFTNFSRALSFQDVAVTANGISATVTNNVFDFTIDAAPKVATLTNVKDAIDATNNQWGDNTVLATVQGYVALAGDTAVQGGSIDLDPITQP